MSGNILLINCCFSFPAAYGRYHYIPTGLLSIGTVLRNADFNVRIIDTRLSRFCIKYLREQLKDFSPDIVGLSFMTDNIFSAKRLAEIIRAERPEAKIVLGGPHVTVEDESSLHFVGADVVARGDGEETLLELSEHFISHTRRLEEIDGITFLREGTVVRNPGRPEPDLAALPSLNYELLDDFRNNYAGTVITGRGCPYRCTFCAAGCLSASYRTRPLEEVVEEFVKLKELYGIKYFQIVDDTFVANPERVKKLCANFKRLFKPNEDFFWYAEGRSNILAENPDLIPIMKEAGLVRLQLGVESGSKRQLKAYRKKITTRQVKKVVRQCLRAKVEVACSFIIGGPFEDAGTEKEQLKFIKRIVKLGRGVLEVITSFLSPLPGTDIRNRLEDYGLKVLDKELITSDYFNYPVVETSRMTKKDIIRERFKIAKIIHETFLSIMKKIDRATFEYLERIHKNCGILHASLLLKDANTDFIKDVTENFYKWKLTNNVYRAFSDVPPEELGAYCPERNFAFLLGVEDGRLTINTANNSVKLEEFEERLFELSAGKLTFDEITERLLREKVLAGDRNVIIDKMKETYLKFERMKLIHLREV